MKFCNIFTTLIVIFLSACATATPVPTPTLIPTSITGKWEITTDTSAMDDSQTVILKIAAESQIQGWLDKFLPVLIIRCKEHELEVYVHTGTQSEVEYGVDTSTVRVRFDKGTAQTLITNHSDDGKALFFQDPISILNEGILAHETMLFEFTPFNASPAETSFDLHGISEAIKPLQKACPK